jgi:hypothetical protein
MGYIRNSNKIIAVKHEGMDRLDLSVSGRIIFKMELKCGVSLCTGFSWL